MADEILEMAKDAIGRDSNKKPYHSEYHGEERANEEAEEDDLEFNDSKVSIRSVHKLKRGKPTKISKGKYELSLDDLVEKVKERLQSEIAQMAASAAKKKILLQSKEKKSARLPNQPVLKYASYDVPSAVQQTPNKNHPSKYLKNIRDNKENRPRQEQRKRKLKRETEDQKYVAEMFVAEPPKYLYNLGSPVPLQQSVHPQPVTVKIEHNHNPRTERNKIPRKQHQINNNNQNINRQRPVTHPKHTTTTTTQAVESFIGVNMATNDSYEDYVVPKKDKNYFEAETRPKIAKKVLENFSIEYEDTSKGKESAKNEGDTTNYNKKKKNKEHTNKNDDNKYFKQRPSNTGGPNVEPLIAENTEQSIQPYAEQLQDTVYADEIATEVTEEQKAQSAVIPLKDYINSQYLTTHVVKPIAGNKNKKIKKPRQATDIPKRDMYKLSSPNYLVKIPIVGEKYRFDEPIPEEDRVRENLEPVGNPQGLINGKVAI